MNTLQIVCCLGVFSLIFPLLPYLPSTIPREPLTRVPTVTESLYALFLWSLWPPSWVPVLKATQVNRGQPLKLYRALINANTTWQSYENDEDNASIEWEKLF